MTDPVDLSGFSGWVTFAELASTEVPRLPGVYVVVRPADDLPQFVDAVPYKGDSAVPLAELDAGWVAGEHIVYIGKADRGAKSDGLHRRLRQFHRYGEGGSARHSGGRRIWQLADHAALLVGWQVTDDDRARSTEQAMIAQFVAHHQVRPFANQQD